VCIAMELLTKPSLLFLDEPTSGLDSATALSVCGTLKKLARRGECTVITTIHQPQTKIWEMMDNLLLLVAGEITYQGLCSKAVDYYASIGYPCPDRSNPADHIMDVIAKRYKRDAPKTVSKDTSITANVEDGIPLDADDDHKENAHNPADSKTIAAFQHPPINLDFGVEKDDFTLRAVIPWFYQFSILLLRCSQEWVRRWDVIVINACVATLIGCFVGYGPWNDIGTSQDGLKKYTPILFFCVIHQGVIASLQGCFSFPLERALMIRERSSGTYYVSAYFLAKSMADMSVQSIAPIVYSLVVYPNVGFKEYERRFGGFLLFNLLNTLACVSMTTFISCLCVTIERTTVIIACYLEVARLYSNFFMSPFLMKDYPTWQWISNISHMKYAFIGLVLNQYTDMEFYCTTKQYVNGKCPTTNGNKVIADNDYDIYDENGQIWQVILLIICARIAGYVCLRFIKT
jgi:ATP-binding cassette subfamily G (WHITE) protein 2